MVDTLHGFFFKAFEILYFMGVALLFCILELDHRITCFAMLICFLLVYGPMSQT